MNVYEQNADLYTYANLDGQTVTFEYLPTSRSRKPRRCSNVITNYDHKIHDHLCDQIKKENGWYSVYPVKA